MIGLILAAALLLNSMVINQLNKLWWVDPVVSLVCGIVAFCYGVFGLRQARAEGVPLCSRQWWTETPESTTTMTNKTMELPPTGSNDDDEIV